MLGKSVGKSAGRESWAGGVGKKGRTKILWRPIYHVPNDRKGKESEEPGPERPSSESQTTVFTV